MKELTEASLEEAMLEICKLRDKSGELLQIKPNFMYLRMDVMEELAAEHGVSVEHMVAVIQQLVQAAHDG